MMQNHRKAQPDTDRCDWCGELLTDQYLQSGFTKKWYCSKACESMATHRLRLAIFVFCVLATPMVCLLDILIPGPSVWWTTDAFLVPPLALFTALGLGGSLLEDRRLDPKPEQHRY